MSFDPRTAVAIRNAMLATFVATLNGGFLEIYDGAKPATADTAITTQHLLATLTFGSPAFPAPSAGSDTANAITPGTCVYAATATWFRMYESDNTTVIGDGTVGTSGCDMNFTTNIFVVNARIECASFVVTMS